MVPYGFPLSSSDQLEDGKQWVCNIRMIPGVRLFEKKLFIHSLLPICYNKNVDISGLLVNDIFFLSKILHLKAKRAVFIWYPLVYIIFKCFFVSFE